MPMNQTINKGNSKSLGQYMTPRFVAEFMASLISKPSSASILEPGAGEGIFLKVLYEKGFKNITAYEIDEQLGKESPIKINYSDFLKIPPKPEFDVIIGNPPYVRWKNIPEEWRSLFRKDKYWKKIMNGLCDLTYAFIYHAINFLKTYGELIFICPLFWTETVHGKHLREFLSNNGSVELLINLNEAKIFKQVSSTIIIFKYIKNVKLPYVKIIEYQGRRPVTPEVMHKISLLIKELEFKAKNLDFYLEEENYRAYLSEQFIGGAPWRPVPPREKIVKKIDGLQDVYHIGDIAEIGNGMVSGLDAAFRLDEEELKALNNDELNSLIYVYKSKTLERFFPLTRPIPYIFINHVTSEEKLRKKYPYFYHKLLHYKDRLKQRYSYGRNIPWWHWVFLRNKKLFERYNAKIFVPSKERYNTRGYFRFSLIRDEKDKTFYATQDVTAICIKKGVKEKVEYILGLLNSEPIQRWIMIKGFSRGGVYDFSEEPIRIIPIPRIDWNNSKETELYRLIVEIVGEIITYRQLNKVRELNNYVKKLIELKKVSKVLPLTTFNEQN